VYVRPGNTIHDAFIEYKGTCLVTPQPYCPHPFGQDGGGRWFSFMDINHCPQYQPGAASDASGGGDLQVQHCADQSHVCAALQRMSAHSRAKACDGDVRVRCPASCLSCEEYSALNQSLPRGTARPGAEDNASAHDADAWWLTHGSLRPGAFILLVCMCLVASLVGAASLHHCRRASSGKDIILDGTNPPSVGAVHDAPCADAEERWRGGPAPAAAGPALALAGAPAAAPADSGARACHSPGDATAAAAHLTPLAAGSAQLY